MSPLEIIGIVLVYLLVLCLVASAFFWLFFNVITPRLYRKSVKSLKELHDELDKHWESE